MVASLRIRIAAFLIDGFILGILHACFWVVVVVAAWSPSIRKPSASSKRHR